jgi:hypothetical protein
VTGAWGDGHGLADDIPVVLCALGFGCGGTPKSAGEGVQLERSGRCVNTVTPDLTTTKVADDR